MGKLELRYCDKVRYAELHQHLNHAKYFSYFEQARVEYFQTLGFSITSDYKSIPFIVASAHCDYKAPVRLGDDKRCVFQRSHDGNRKQEF